MIYPDLSISFDHIGITLFLSDGKDSSTLYPNRKRVHKYYESRVICEYDLSSDILSRMGKTVTAEICYGNILSHVAFQRVLPRAKWGLTMMTLFKGDYDLLEPWIMYYSAIGVEHFFLYINESVTDALYKALGSYGHLVTLVEWTVDYWIDGLERKEGKAWIPNALDERLVGNTHHAQPMAMNHALYRFGPDTKYMAYFDLDEFVVLYDHRDIKDLLAEYPKSDILIFQCCWASCHLPPPDCRHIKSFRDYPVYRNKETEGPNSRTKQIVRTSTVNEVGIHNSGEDYQTVLLQSSVAQFLHIISFSVDAGQRQEFMRHPLVADSRPKELLDRPKAAIKKLSLHVSGQSGLNIGGGIRGKVTTTQRVCPIFVIAGILIISVVIVAIVSSRNKCKRGTGQRIR